ncbi:META domain-containing protein [Hyunsoonleella aestuarii]|nr:META domain-containing protein [Hyunsoonleella aestuarii]
MKFILSTLSIIILRCCWGPSDYQIMQSLEPENSTLKELSGLYNIAQISYADVSTFNLNISFDKNTKQASGFSGCNRFYGSYLLDNEMLKFGAMASTKMLCQDAANAIESKMLKALEDANTILFSESGFSLFKNKTLLVVATKEIQTMLSFEYGASSRGYFKHIKIDNKHISVSSKRGKDAIIKNCSESDWNKLVSAIENIEVKYIENLDPPSKKHQFDGAPMARLTITKNGTVYKTQGFDDGNPPEAIASLVKEILSIAENIE